MKIGLLTDAYKPVTSGVTTSLLMLKEGLEELGHEVYVIAPTSKKYQDYDKDNKYIIRIKGIPFFKNGLKHFRLIPFIKRYVKPVKELNLDVIHVHTEFSLGTLGKALKDRTQIPMVFTVHTLYEEYLHYVSKILNRLFKPYMIKAVKRLMNSFLKRAEVVIVPSTKIEKLMLTYNNEANYKIIPTGLDLNKFYKNNYQEKELLELKKSLNIKDEFICLYVGRISEEKSIDVLINGFKQANNSNMKFLIVGDGPYLHELKSLVKKLDLTEKVIFTGMVKWEDVGLYYLISDVFLNASLTETQGLTYIEALASDSAVIVKYDSVLDSVITDGYNGLFFHNDDELPNLINKVSTDKKLMETLKSNAYKSVKKYSKEEYAKNAILAYEEAIKINKKY